MKSLPYALLSLVPFFSSLAAGQATTTSTAAPAPAIGRDNDFIFDNDMDGYSKKPAPLVKAGSIIRLQWYIQPATTPKTANVSLDFRSDRVWPDVGEWMLIGKEIPNEEFYDWTVPENLITGSYVIRIGSNQVSPAIRNRTSRRFTIYQGKDAINGKIYLTDSGQAPTVSGGPMWVLASMTTVVSTWMLFMS